MVTLAGCAHYTLWTTIHYSLSYCLAGMPLGTHSLSWSIIVTMATLSGPATTLLSEIFEIFKLNFSATSATSSSFVSKEIIAIVTPAGKVVVYGPLV